MRIFVDDLLELKKEYEIHDNDILKHVIIVMRKNVNQYIEVADFSRNVYKSKITHLNPLIILPETLLGSGESNINIDIYQGLPKFDKMELIIEKAVELGVRNIYPVEMQRSVVRLDEENKIKKLERWNKISETAAKQSQRDIIPEVKEITKIQEINFDQYDINIFLDTKEEQSKTLEKLHNNIKNAKREIKNISIIIGPEGGLTEEERKELEFNTIPIKLGRRILRTETASIVIVSILQYLFGDI